jgi:hypothetical protein
MSAFVTQVLPLVVLLLLGFFTYTRIHNYVNYPGSIPCIGKRGVFGFMISALRYTANAEAIILEGKAKYGNQPFAVPTLVSV